MKKISSFNNPDDNPDELLRELTEAYIEANESADGWAHVAAKYANERDVLKQKLQDLWWQTFSEVWRSIGLTEELQADWEHRWEKMYENMEEKYWGIRLV